jgi:type II secretory pathway pseudopilin PulG
MRNQSRAFTRIELLAIIVMLSLLCAFALPLLATTRQDSERAACVSNLRQVGRATLLWAGDHADRVPWWTPTIEGGTMTNKSMVRVGVAFE